jgi:heme exporter protein CcmD
MPEILDMGKYAPFVWPSYGLTVLIMAGLVVTSVRRLKRCKRELRALGDPLAAGGRRAAKRDETT